MGTIASQTSPFVDQTKLEDVYEFLQVYTDIFTKNVHATKGFTCKNLKTLIENKYLVVISSDKDSCVVILKRSDHDEKLQSMIDEVIAIGLKKEIYRSWHEQFPGKVIVRKRIKRFYLSNSKFQEDKAKTLTTNCPCVNGIADAVRVRSVLFHVL